MKIQDIIDYSIFEDIEMMCIKSDTYTKYENGKKTEIIKGSVFEVVIPSFKYDKVSIKIENMLKPKIKIDEKSDPINVNFTGIKVIPYIFNNSIKLSFKADDISQTVEIDGGL